MACTRSRSGQGLEASREAKPKRCMARCTACTWPCANERVISKVCATGCSISPRRVARIESIWKAGKPDRLAGVRLQSLAPSR